MDALRAARMPIEAQTDRHSASELESTSKSAPPALDCSISRLGISAKADGAAFVLLVSASACDKLGLQTHMRWVSSASTGCAPDTPLLAAQKAAQHALQQAALANGDSLHSIELHDAFAVQGLSFAQALGLNPERLNPRGGGLARGHPIGASGAIALVQLLANMALDAPAGGLGLVAVAGAGGVGAAAVVAPTAQHMLQRS
jgi:acetyl-CoA C-acetyltransferase